MSRTKHRKCSKSFKKTQRINIFILVVLLLSLFVLFIIKADKVRLSNLPFDIGPNPIGGERGGGGGEDNPGGGQELCTPRAGPNNYYVDGDSLCGICSDLYTKQQNTITTPWCTLQKAVNLVQTGDKILIQPGEYFEGDHVITQSQSGDSSYLAGTVRCIYGSKEIRGQGTRFLTQVRVGDFIRCDKMPSQQTMGNRPGAFFPWTQIESIGSDTYLILREPYRGESDIDGSGDDQVGRFIVFEGLEPPDDVRIIGRVTEQQLGLQFFKYEGAPFDCDEELSGQQDCINVYYFDLPSPGAYHLTGDTFGPNEYGSLFQRSTLTRYPFRTEQHDKNYFNGDLDPYFNLNVEGIATCGNLDIDVWDRGCNNEQVRACTSWSECKQKAIPRLNKVPGTMWVDRGASPQRWYFSMRNGQNPLQPNHDRIELSHYNNIFTINSADYVVVRNISFWPGTTSATYGSMGFSLVSYDSNPASWVLMDNIRNYGSGANFFGPVDFPNIVLEDSIFRTGINWGGTWSKSAMINTEISGSAHYAFECGSMLGAGGNPQGWQDGLILDRMLIHHTFSGPVHSQCLPCVYDVFDWRTNTWINQRAGSHTLQCDDTESETRANYLWVQNSIIGRGSDAIQIGAYPGKGPNVWNLRWVYNSGYLYDGNDGAPAGDDFGSGIVGDQLDTDETVHDNYLHLGNVWFTHNTLGGRLLHLSISEGDYSNIGRKFQSDYNAYINDVGVSDPLVWVVSGTRKVWGDISDCIINGYENLRCKDNNNDDVGDFEQNGIMVAYANENLFRNSVFRDMQLGDNYLDWTPRQNSPLRDKINATQYYCPDHDFYGNKRNDGLCDIGAAEYKP